MKKKIELKFNAMENQSCLPHNLKAAQSFFGPYKYLVCSMAKPIRLIRIRHWFCTGKCDTIRLMHCYSFHKNQEMTSTLVVPTSLIIRTHHK